MNSDGRTPGISQPSCDAQIELIRRTYDRFGLALDQTRYFEAHGTGTKVGDPIEAEAIATVFRSNQADRQPMYIGALKSNIGHLEGASGVAAVIKALLVLEHGVIPPNAWFERQNPSIKEEWRLSFPTSPVPWPDSGLRRASINSFGFGGTNAHAVIDDARSVLTQQTNGVVYHSNGVSSSQRVAKIFVLSAVDEKAVARVCEAYRAHLVNKSQQDDDETKDSHYEEALAFTLSQRRSHFPWRSFFLSNPDQGFQNLEFSPAVQINSKMQVCFLFTGQGAQWVAMGKELLSHKAFRQSLENSDLLLRDIGCQFSVIGMINTPSRNYFDLNNLDI